MRLRFGLGCALLLVVASSWVSSRRAQAEVVYLTVENISSDTPVTPVFAGFHDGTYNLGSRGSAASASLELLAELGMTAPITAEFTGGGANRVAGDASGVLMPGNTATTRFNVDLAGANRYLSLATMVLPSSDYFFGTVAPNGGTAPFGVDIGSLSLTNPITFDLTTVYDAGTELNDFRTSAPPNPAMMFGGVFQDLPVSDPELSADELDPLDRVIRPVANPFTGFENTPVGFTPPASFGLRFSLSVPEPTSAMTVGLVLGGIILRRRRQA